MYIVGLEKPIKNKKMVNKNYEEIKKKLKELSLELEELKKEEYIESPFFSDSRFFIDLIVNKKQTLHHYSLKLKVRKTPTPVDKLEVGKFYVVYDSENYLSEVINYTSYYKLYLGNGKYVSSNDAFREHSLKWEYWHEVLLLE